MSYKVCKYIESSSSGHESQDRLWEKALKAFDVEKSGLKQRDFDTLTVCNIFYCHALSCSPKQKNE